MSAMLLIAAQDPKVHLTSQTRILAAVISPQNSKRPKYTARHRWPKG